MSLYAYPVLALPGPTANWAGLRTLSFNISGKPSAGQILKAGTAYDASIAANAAGTNVTLGTLPTSSWTWDLSLIAADGTITSLGLVVISSLGSVTLPTFPQTTIPAGGGIQLTAPGSQDATASDPLFVIPITLL